MTIGNTDMLKELQHEGADTWAKAWGDALDGFMKFCIQKVSGITVDSQKKLIERGR